ncbi:MAG: nucleotidyltransferase family protein [Anaerolineales bacterium]|nr:nucleotidyltransferase family protein [Anaerolineales bacterium]
MNDLIDSVIAFQEFLTKEGIPVMAIGGIAVAVWGEPRLTRDIDMKVLVSREDRGQLLAILGAFTPLQEDSDESFRRLGLAFFRDSNGVRIDVMLADTIFDEAAIGRARDIDFTPGKKIRVCTAEDLIVYKMLSTRTKDRGDVESVVQKQGDALDDAYIENWLAQFEEALSDSTLIRDFRKIRTR